MDVLGGGGGFCPPFVHVDKRGGGVCKISTLVHSRRVEGQNWDKKVHVVVEWPISNKRARSNKRVLMKGRPFCSLHEKRDFYYIEKCEQGG